MKECELAGITPDVFEGIDGPNLFRDGPVPRGWERDGAGAYGCLQGHLRILERCILDNVNSVLVLEDDVVFVDDFRARFLKFISTVPADWDCLFLGGQHVKAPVETETPGVVRCQDTRRTHAYLIRGRMLHDMHRVWAGEAGHCDWSFGRHQPDYQVYAPVEWLAGQAEGKSDITGRDLGERFWKSKRVAFNFKSRTTTVAAGAAQAKPRKCGCGGGA